MNKFFTISFMLLSFGNLTSARELTDVRYTFDATKLSGVSSSSDLLTSFVDYFYLVVAQNNSNLGTLSPSSPYAGWCVGDAHLENFGALIQQDGTTLFTMNDMDDSGPCPVALDLFRLMVSARLTDGTVNLADMLAAYGTGLSGLDRSAPAVIDQLMSKSLKRGAKVDSKKVDTAALRFVRAADTEELTRTERDSLTTAIAGFPELAFSQILDMLRRAKTSGGSGGLSRFETLLQLGGDLLHIEFKEQVRPGIYPVASAEIPNVKERIARSLQLTQGSTASAFYQVVNINSTDMLIRPRFAGNVTVKTSSLQSAELNDLASYEAYTLGRIHARSVDKSWLAVFQKMPPEMWSQDVDAMVAQFNKKFDELKATSH